MKKIDFPNGKFAIYDDEFEELVSKYKWSCAYNKRADKHYMITSIDNKSVCLSRLIKPCSSNLVVIYKNGETLDYRKENLLVINKSQNQARLRSRIEDKPKGVYFVKKSGNYRATICISGKTLQLGCFEFQKDAVEAYNKKAKELYGDLAFQNKI